MTERAGSAGGRILVLGVSVAAGLGLLGAMATSAAANQQPVTSPVPGVRRVIVIEQPAASDAATGVGSGATTASSTPEAQVGSTNAPSGPPADLPSAPPRAVVIESAPAEPITTTEGS